MEKKSKEYKRAIEFIARNDRPFYNAKQMKGLISILLVSFAFSVSELKVIKDVLKLRGFK